MIPKLPLMEDIQIYNSDFNKNKHLICCLKENTEKSLILNAKLGTKFVFIFKGFIEIIAFN